MRWAVPLALVLATAIVQLARCTELAPPSALAETPLPALRTVDAPRTIDELRARIAEVLARERVPGVAIALVDRDGPQWIGGVGIADTETRAPVTGDTVFRVASITKAIVGLGVMRLVEQRRLALDRPIAETLRDVPIDNAWDAVAPVTLAELLEHTAGLDDMRPNEVFVDDDAMTPAAALAKNPRSRTIRWRPGSRPAYSNVGYGLAGRAIEIATGEPFDAWLRREVLLPLGMREADFRRTDALRAQLATGYHGDTRMEFRPIAHRPAGALLASASELARLVQFWLRRGDGFPAIVSPAGLDRIEHTGTLPYAGTDTDYGLGNYGDVSPGFRSRGHDGGLPGFVSTLRYFPELGVGFVLLFNATHSFTAVMEVRQLVYAYLARDRSTAPQPAAIATAGPDAEFYQFASPRHALLGFIDEAIVGVRATELRDRVRLDPLIGRGLDLVPTRDGAYRFPGGSGSAIRFTHDRDGAPVMIGMLGYHEAAAYGPARWRTIALGIAVVLLQLAPVWAAAALAWCLVRRSRVVALDLLLAPAIAGLALSALPRLAAAAELRQVSGECNPLTIAICACTLVFAIAACVGARATLRWCVRRDRPALLGRLIPSATSIAAFVLTAWLAANGLIGLRTWAW